MKVDTLFACSFPHTNIVNCVIGMGAGRGGKLECYSTGRISHIGILSIFNVDFSFEIRSFGIVLNIKVNTFQICN